MAIVGSLIILVGSLISLFFSIQILIKNFQENVLWGLASLFFGLPFLIFVAMRWEDNGSNFLKSLGASLGSALLGGMFIAMGS